MAKNPTVGPATAVLCLVRHGDAGEPLALPQRDRARALTEKGRRQAKRAGRALARLGLAPRDVWTSRILRGRETARIATKAADLAVRPVESVALAPDAAPERAVRALREPSAGAKADAPDVRWIVGHEPHLSRLLGHLTGAPPAAFRLAKGSVAVVEFPGREVAAGAGRLTALLTPEALKDIG